jgi:hypothetical protein
MEVTKIRAEERLQVNPKTVWKVSVWKDDVDPSSPWWLKVYYRHVYLRFLDFSFWIGVPKAKEVVVESDEHGNVRQTFQWFEDIGTFDSEAQADAACLTERYGYMEIPHGESAPFESAQLKGTFFPRKKHPKKWAKPVLSLIVKHRKQEENERELIQRINKALD